ncbi:Gfo/Idh/MocA family oxidoreductase [Lederbergia sp. NSJ-179]|uniref:Gfo/Idh/MocA family protein n=1 Tax=Lederbergia sp. NSJ-179 TaxID=2931402 RepID=UPI001FD1705E|nr:Gfo/Idh/MocA family oxidoreductase [Lederbergia sp. NSJ-179]MCJ7842990.1 Gfo/Idh/MocA family oxidoreductase [Lederbergia sp. NSJ-179]
MLKAAVVGVRHIGKVHCRYYQEIPDVELVAVCDLDQKLAEAAAQQFGVKAYTDIKALLAHEEIDVVSIATGGIENGSHHFEPAMIAIEKGKDVLVEKPLSNQLSEAREMIAFAQEKGVRIACNLNHRFAPAASKAKEWIDHGNLGSLLYVNMKLTIGNQNESTPWIHLRALHPHSVDVMRYFGGEIKRVQAFMTKAPGRKVWSTASINMEFASGAVGHLTGSYDMDNRHPIEQCEVAGTKGRFVIEDVYNEATFYPHHQSELTVIRNSVLTGMEGFNATFKNRLHTFVNEITLNVPPDEISGSGKEALAAQEVIETAIRSHQENGAVVEVKALKQERKK